MRHAFFKIAIISGFITSNLACLKKPAKYTMSCFQFFVLYIEFINSSFHFFLPRLQRPDSKEVPLALADLVVYPVEELDLLRIRRVPVLLGLD